MNWFNIIKTADRVSYLKETFFKDNPEIFDSIITADPTPNRMFLQWIIKLYNNKTIRVPEDNQKITEALNKFLKVRNKQNFTYSKDINQYKTFGELFQVLSNYSNSSNREEKEKGRSGQFTAPKGSEIVFDKNGYKVLKITDASASSVLCSGTAWCVADKETAQKYLSQGPLYLIYENGERLALFHYEAGQFMDTNDKPLDSDIKFQLVEMFYGVTGKNHLNTPELAFDYAENVLAGPFPEGEDAISKDAEFSFNYAKDILKGPFLKGEDAISKDWSYSHFYARDIIKGRWEKGEKAISAYPQTSLDYATHVLKGPFPAGEKAISTDAFRSYFYAKYALKGPFPAGEHLIKQTIYVDDYMDLVEKYNKKR